MTEMLRIMVHSWPVPSSVAGKMTVWKGTLSLPMNCACFLGGWGLGRFGVWVRVVWVI